MALAAKGSLQAPTRPHAPGHQQTLTTGGNGQGSLWKSEQVAKTAVGDLHAAWLGTAR
jgi:hypothetical protein